MSDLQILFLVLAGFYGWECTCWLRRGSVGFTTWLGRHWRGQHPGTLLGNARGGFIFAAPLPPLGTLLTASQFPLSLSPDGALDFAAANVNPGWRPVQSGRWLAFDDLREARAEGRKVFVNGRVWLAASSAGVAQRLARELARLAKLKRAERDSAIRELAAASLDTRALKARWQEFRRQSRRLRWLANAMVLHLFVVTPFVILRFGLSPSWLGLVLALGALAVTAATLFCRAHRMLYPEAEDERFTHTLTIALSPANAMRAHDTLSRPLLESFHPLAVAQVFLSPAAFQTLARRILLDLRHPARPVCPSNNAVVRAAEEFWRTALREAVEARLRREEIQPDDLCRPPTRAEETCRAYCPRCHAQFTSGDASCADCGGLPLVVFPSPSWELGGSTQVGHPRPSVLP